PVLGVNLGRLGFMVGALADDLRDAVETALAGEARIERRATLSAEVQVGGREAGTYRALNEVFVGRGPSGRAVRAGVSVNGTLLDTFTCDGVAVATPTGSTAYALSAGGPLLAPDVSGLLVVPVCAHTLRARPIVVAASDTVEISFPDPSRAGACVMVDGDSVPCRQSVERVAVTRGAHDVSLVKLGGRDFYEVCRDEFFGG
ncbi:MAG: NAD(+)/NADH kinase, partial [Actinobacteria bacterium]